ncbi:MAG: site-specific DNA-methyltransferase [Chloroflexi bacterium]|nr:site-specific DNA-methyltransferase [Chloroflexota bacterium]
MLSLKKLMDDFITEYGRIIHQDSLKYMQESIKDESIDLIFTSPPFALLRKKDYGNVEEDKYVAWFTDFAQEFYRTLKPTGSLVIDIGGSWIPGQPTRSLYHFELLIMLCRKLNFHLAQELYWWNPSKLPTPAEWVNVRRIRVKDGVNCVYWLSKTPWPKASNRRVLTPYSDSMLDLIKNGYEAKLRPSGHDISDKFQRDNGGAIPPNLIAIPNTESNSYYLRYCKEHNIKPHPARFPSRLPEYFIRMLTDTGDTIFDPFGGSCVTGEVCDHLERNWICCETIPEYIEGAKGRFAQSQRANNSNEPDSYKIYSPSTLWNGSGTKAYDDLPADGGKKRPKSNSKKTTTTKNGTVRDAKPKDVQPKQPGLFD